MSIIYSVDREEETKEPDCEGGTRSAAAKKPLSLEKRLRNLYRYLEKGDFRNYNGDSMKKDLMFLHELLIKPIAHILRKMKPDDNLMLCPSEVWRTSPLCSYSIELHREMFMQSFPNCI